MGTLKRHTLPTGGYVDYQFESNTVRNFANPATNDQRQFKWTNCNSSPPGNSLDPTCCVSLSSKYPLRFQNARQIQQAEYILAAPIVHKGASSTVCADWKKVDVYIKIIDKSDNTVVASDHLQVDPYITSGKLINRKEGILGELTNDIEVDGEYELLVQARGGYAEVEFFLPILRHNDPQNQPVGGLRIAKITSFDPIDEVSSVKRYEYSETDNTSSGKLVQQPIYRYYGLFQSLTHNALILEFRSNSVVPLGDFDGRTVGYRRVTESIVGQGRTEYTFNNTVPESAASSSYPRRPVMPTFIRGTPITIKMYAEDGNDPVSETTFRGRAKEGVLTYSDGRRPLAYTYHVPAHPEFGYQCQSVNTLGTIPAVAPYFLPVGHYQLDSKSSTLDKVLTEERYTYGSPGGYRYMTTKRTFDGYENEINRMEYRYPEHFLDDPAYLEMSKRNILLPVSTQEYVDGEAVDGNRTYYGFFNGGSHPYPARFERYEAINGNGVWRGGWKEQGRIFDYNAKGLPTRHQRQGWEEEVYTWTSSGLIKSRSYTATTLDTKDENQARTLTTTYHYKSDDNSRLLERIVAPDNQVTSFVYDDLSRLEKQSARDGKVETTYTYTLPGASAVAAGQPNSILTTTTYDRVADSELSALSKLREQTTIDYFDGLGRGIQTVLKAHSDDASPLDVVTVRKYDKRGRVERVYDPFKSMSKFS